MTSEKFQIYRHSGRFGIHGPVLVVVLGAVAAFLLGYAYSYLIKWIPLVYVNFLATLGYGFVFGFLGGWIMRIANVRNSAIACISGLILGGLALYGAWNGHVNATFRGAPIFCTPGEIVGAMRQLYEEGSWGIGSHGNNGGNISGVPLAIVWLVEAGMVIGIATAVCTGEVNRTPFCEISQCWLDQTKKIDTLDRFSDQAQLGAFRSGDLGPLLQAKPRVPETGAWTRILLKFSPRCETFHTVRLQNVQLEADKNGNLKEKAKDITKDLVLPAAMLPLISKFEDFKPQASAASDAAPEQAA